MTREAFRSAVYVGHVAHRRLRPRVHTFRYRAYWLLIDIDELPRLDRRLRLFSLNRWNLFSFYDRDHTRIDAQPLRQALHTQLEASGIDLAGGAIRSLCMPRVLGFVFNPLSVHFCHHADGRLAAIVYEVHNTFGQRHSYLVGVPRSLAGLPLVKQGCAKRFYVSPFMEMEMDYRFKVRPPADDVSVVICGDDRDGALIVASMTGQRRPLTDAMLVRQFFSLPFLTLKVVAAIHWEALRLWLKGVKLVARPAPPRSGVTVGATREMSLGE